MDEIDRWVKARTNKSLVADIKKSQSLESWKPMGFIASKNKDFSVKKIFPISTFFHEESKKLVVCLIDKQVKVYSLD